MVRSVVLDPGATGDIVSPHMYMGGGRVGVGGVAEVGDSHRDGQEGGDELVDVDVRRLTGAGEVQVRLQLGESEGEPADGRGGAAEAEVREAGVHPSLRDRVL